MDGSLGDAASRCPFAVARRTEPRIGDGSAYLRHGWYLVRGQVQVDTACHPERWAEKSVG
ncbi:hypothetical protein AB4039_04155 [Streptomyces sp. M-16]|uniref:hypothetical protein n=1 Tax=Streptomyces sp. M-16 TaxID=3233040 RepID=UPI003F9BEDD0